MAYKKTDYVNNNQPAITNNTLNKTEEGVKNNTIWQNAICDVDSDYSIEIDSWETIENSYLQIHFNDAIDNTKNIKLKINNEDYKNLIDSTGKEMIGSDLENKDVFLRFDSTNFIAFTYNISLTFDLVYPVGSIYLSVNSMNPSYLFGGTWEIWSRGRVPVGLDPNDNDFNIVEKVGGASTVTLTTAQMPTHTHNQNPHAHGSTGIPVQLSQVGAANPASSNWASGWFFNGGSIYETTAYNQNAGGGSSHDNKMKYITCYMWKRIA